MAIADRAGCREGGKGGSPKRAYPTREQAQSGLEWMVDNMGTSRERVRVYECRYSPPGEPHFHVGKKPIPDRRNYGRRKR